MGRCLAMPTWFVLVAIFAAMSSPVRAGQPTLIAPFMESLELCPGDGPAHFINCASRKDDSVATLENALNKLGPAASKDGAFTLGYTLPVRLLSLFTKTPTGWQIDKAHIDAILGILKAVDRPVVLHVASNHFAADDNPELTAELAADPRNLMVSMQGPFPQDSYFVNKIYPWTIADFDAPVNQMRRRAMTAFLNAACALNPAIRRRVQAVSVVGEDHHLWTDFLKGPGYNHPFVVSDYSPASVAQFQDFVATQFGHDIALLNAELGAHFTSFDKVLPPSRNMFKETVTSSLDHIDANAGGQFAVYGWVHDTGNSDPVVLVFLDGALQAETVADYSRTDVLEAKPELKTPNVGFDVPVDYSRYAPGIHKLGVYVLASNGKLVELSVRDITIVDREQRPSTQAQAYAPPQAEQLGAHPEIAAYLDGPAALTPMVFNPLARLFFAFREEQVRHNLEYFADIAAGSCFGRSLVFSHQVTRSSAAWNEEMGATAESLLPNTHYRYGVTLYGGLAFGKPFFDTLKQQGITGYGIGELHPLTPLSVDDMVAMLRRHHEAGASYLAPYFIPLNPTAKRTEYEKYLITEAAPTEASRNFWAALHRVMTEPH